MSTERFRLVLVSGGTSDPSSTRLLADRTADRVTALAGRRGPGVVARRSDPALNTRIDRAAVELVLLMESGFAAKIKDESWQSYQHEYGSAGGTETAIDLDTDLMRLATGGSAS